MRDFVETIQTSCECNAMVAQQFTSYNISAKVKEIPAIGRRLVISINPPINAINRMELTYDGSKLPEDMVKDWLESHLNNGQILASYQVIDSDKHDKKIKIVN